MRESKSDEYKVSDVRTTLSIFCVQVPPTSLNLHLTESPGPSPAPLLVDLLPLSPGQWMEL